VVTFGPHTEDFANDANPSQPGFDFTGAFQHDILNGQPGGHVITDPSDISGRGLLGTFYDIDTSANSASGFALYLTAISDVVTFPNLASDQEVHFVKVDAAADQGAEAIVRVAGKNGVYSQTVASATPQTVSVGYEHILPSGLELGPIQSVTLMGGIISFTGDETSSFSNLTILVEQAGQVEPPPVAVDYTASILADQTATVDVFANDSDPDGDTIQLVGVETAGHGAAHIDQSIPGTIDYTPDQGFVGTDSFSYTIVDQKGSEATATITVTVSEPIDAPADDVFEVPHGFRGPFQVSAPGVLANDPAMPDPDDTVTLVIVSQGNHGTVALNADGSFLYTPNGGPNALVLNDTFTYAFTDGTSTSAPATVHLVPINQPPEAALDATFSIVHGFRGVFTSAAPGVLENDPTPYDPDGDAVTPVIVQQGQFGTAAINADGSFSYTPNGGANALVLDDTFSYALNDGYTNGPPARIHLVPVNQLPVAVGFQLQFRHDLIGHPVSLGSLLSDASDPDGDSLTVVSAVSQAGGTITVDALGDYTYTPPAHTVHDQIAYQVSDGYVASNQATIDLLWANTPPADPMDVSITYVSSHDKLEGIDGADLLIPPRNPQYSYAPGAVDGDGDQLEVVIIQGPAHGTLSSLDPNTGGFNYTPAGPLLLTDTFTYAVTDGFVTSNPATVALVPELAEPILYTDVYGVSRGPSGQTIAGQIHDVLDNDRFPDGTPLKGRAKALVASLPADPGVILYSQARDASGNKIKLHEGDPLEDSGGFDLFVPNDIHLVRFEYTVVYDLNDDSNPPTARGNAVGPLGLVFVRIYDKGNASDPVNATGIPADVENGAPNNGDGNGDHIPDVEQDNVGSLPNAVTDTYVTLVAPPGTQLFNVQALPPPADAPPGLSFPLGVFSFSIVGLDTSKPFSVTIHLASPLPDGYHYYKFGPTDDNSQPHWYDFAYNPQTNVGAILFSDTIVLHFPPVGIVQVNPDLGMEVVDAFYDPGGPVLLLRANQTYVGGLYRTLLNRSPEQAGLNHWVLLLDNGLDRQQIAQGIYESPEHRGLQVDQFYATYLHRNPDPAGRTFWTSALLAGWSQTDVVRGFLTSPEYQAAHPDAASFVSGLYADLWGKPLDGPGQSLIKLLPYLPFNRNLIVAGFVNSVQARQRLLDRYYSEFLGRSADAPGEAFWLGVLQTGLASVDRVAEAFLASEEYFARPTGRGALTLGPSR
jgi:hypothetical protein